MPRAPAWQPVEAGRAFPSPFRLSLANYRPNTEGIASSVKCAALDPPGPGVFRDRSGRRLHRHRLVHVSGGGECYNRTACEEGDPESVAVTHFFHPNGEFCSTVDCIRGLTLLLRGAMA